jgi:hypothetical protein
MATNLLDGIGWVQQQGEIGRQQGVRSRVAELASQTYTASPDQRPSLLGQMAGFSPDAAAATEQQFAQRDEQAASAEDRRNKFMVQNARLLASAPEQYRPGLYQKLRPELERLGVQNLPMQYDSTVAQAAQALADAYGAQGGASGVQSTYVDASGNRVAIMRDGSTQILGQNDAGMANQTISIPGPDGRPRQYTFNKRTGAYEPAGAAMSTPGQQASQSQPEAFREFTVNNDGDVPFPTDPNEQAAALQAMRTGGTFAVPGAGPPVRVGAPGADMTRTGGNPFVGQSPAEQAAAVEEAKLRTGLEFAPQQAAADAARETAVVTARETAEAAAKRQAALPQIITKSDQTLGLINQALNHPGRATATGASSTFDPRNYAPGTDARDFQVLLDQLKGQTFLEAFQSLKGGGAITQVEGTKAEQAIARLNTAQSDQAFEQALRELAEVAQSAKQRAIDAAGGGAPLGGQQAPTQAPAQGGKYQPGQVIEVNGRRFRVIGGDPNDPDVEEI